MNSTLRSLLCLATVLVFITPVQATHDSPESRPNVVFILADDLGWRDLSCTGSTFYESPNIDRVANEGIRFNFGYATCQVCSPSRASIMTGKYPARINITDYIGAPAGKKWKRNTVLLPAHYERQLAQEETTLAEAFQSAGYETFFAGKWHLGGEGSFPEDHGFDVNVGGHHRGSPPGGFFTPYKNPKMEDGPEGEYLPVRLGQETADFIEANKDKPFFAYLSFYAVHAPLQTTKDRWAKYRKKALQNPLPDSRFILDRTLPVRQVQDHPVYAGLVEGMDDAVGIVLDRLDKLNLSDNTIVVFTSDNGGVSAGDAKATSNLPFRGGKGRQWEGGLREPYFIRYPQKIKAGSSNDTPVTGTDFYPTLLELCSLPAQPKQHVDGTSLVPLLNNQKIAERPLFWHYPHYGNQGGEPSSIIHKNGWKLIHYYEDGRKELYNIHDDIGEQSNVASKHPERVEAMWTQLQKWLKETDARMPVPNPNFDVEKHKKQQERMRTVHMPNLEKQHSKFLDENYQPNPKWWGSQR